MVWGPTDGDGDSDGYIDGDGDGDGDYYEHLLWASISAKTDIIL